MSIYDPYTGQVLIQPQAAVSVSASPVGQSLPSGQILWLIGTSDLAQPQVATPIGSPSDVAQKLGGGVGAQAAMLCFNPSPVVTAAPSIQFVEVQEKTQATGSMNSTSGSAAVNLAATVWGAPGNQVKWMVSAASGGVGYKVQVGFDYQSPLLNPGPPVVKDNIYLPGITIAYTGTDTSPNVTVNDSTFTVSATSGTTSVTLASITLTSTTTLQQLVNQLNQTSGIVAAVAPGANPNQIAYAFFDAVSALSISTSASSPTTLYANVYAVVQYLNSGAQPFVTATRSANAANIAATTVWTYLSGGSTTAPTNTDWQNAFNYLETVNGLGVVVPLTPSPAVWAMADAHARYMASQYQPRVAVVGDAAGQTLATELANAAALNSPRTLLRWPGFVGTNVSGQTQVFDPFYEAARTGAIIVASPVQRSITLIPVTAQKLETVVSPAMVDQAIQGGVCITKPMPDGTFRIADDVTTWIGSTQFNLVKSQVERELDAIASDLQQQLQTALIGYNANNGSGAISLATSVITARLRYWASQGLLVGAPPFRNLTISASGNAVTASVQVFPAQAVDYALLNIVATPFGG